MSLNENQQEVVDTLSGLLMVDAGPGTGKTHTIVERYIKLIEAKVPVRDILMVTFTRNAAEEMKERISRRMREYAESLRANGDEMSARDIEKSITDVRTSTFDSYCSRIVSNSPEFVSDFFGFKETLSRNARLIENNSMNVDYFSSFFDTFVKEKGKYYVKDGVNIPALFAENKESLYKLISKLMSLGIIPLADYDWFGDGEKILTGNYPQMYEELSSIDLSKSSFYDYAKRQSYGKLTFLSNISALTEDSEITEMIVKEDRKLLIYFIHDIYYSFIKKSVSDNRLTFGLNALFAFIVLYQDESARKFNSVKHLMIDEFQDTNEMQLMTSLMLLNEGNLCVVGDWKQGIYGFRDVSIENIQKFGHRVIHFGKILNSDGTERVRFNTKKEVKSVALRESFRSSSVVLDEVFKSLNAKGPESEDFKPVSEEMLVLLESKKDSSLGDRTEFSAFTSEIDDEFEDIVDRVKEYLFSGKYAVIEGESERAPRPGDIAILFRTMNGCLRTYEALRNAGIPVFLQGDDTVMATRPGKLVLAWLRYINDFRDTHGLAAILINEGFTINQIKAMIKGDIPVPNYITQERSYLMNKRKRPNDLVTSIFAFHRIGEDDEAEADIAQTIVNIISGSYADSLVTISDLIRLIENDLELDTKYPVEQSADRNAVIIQTMHKSKGLEYPFVIVGGLNAKQMPSTKGSSDPFIIDDVFGFRVSKEYQAIKEEDGTECCGILPSWRYRVIKSLRKPCYDEERRLLFVAMSRAKQYLTLMGCGGDKTSCFLEHYNPIAYTKSNCEISEIEGFSLKSDVPVIPEYAGRRMNVSVHDLMEFEPELEGDFESSDSEGGIEYGNRVHKMAEQMASGMPYEELPESEMVREILNSVKDSSILTEIHCSLPVKDVTIRGIIDLIADFGDRIEIHDYKTDKNEKFLNQYILQMSIYAHAVSQARGVPVTCFIDFVTLGRTVPVTPIPLEEIVKKTDDYLSKIYIKNNTGILSRKTII